MFYNYTQKLMSTTVGVLCTYDLPEEMLPTTQCLCIQSDKVELFSIPLIVKPTAPMGR